MGCQHSTLPKSDRVILSHAFCSVIDGNHEYLTPAIKSVGTNYAEYYLEGATLLHMLPFACFTLSHSKFVSTCQMLLEKFGDSRELLTSKLVVRCTLGPPESRADEKPTEESEEEETTTTTQIPTQTTATIPSTVYPVRFQLKIGTFESLFKIDTNSILFKEMSFEHLNVHSLTIQLNQYFQARGFQYTNDIGQNLNYLLSELLALTEDGQDKKKARDTGGGTLCIACQENQINIKLKPCNHGCLCEECAETLQKLGKYNCPACGVAIESQEPLYLMGVEEEVDDVM